MKAFFHELAQKELIESRDFYDDLVYGLGRTFIEEVRKSVDLICASPESFPVVKNQVRRKIVLKFPYSILYTVKEEKIFILAVMHQKRKPNYWIKRTS